jgi:putative peptidoglycan lipid II flippase
LSSVVGGVLQSFKRFFVYSLAPIAYNVGIIVGVLYFVPRWGAHGLAWGVVFGALLHLLVQIPLTLKLGWRYRPVFDLKDTNLRQIFKLMVPRTMSLAVAQINLVVITIFASTLKSGTLSVFNLANNLQSFPIGLFGLSFAVAAFPSLSAAAFDRRQLAESFSTVFRQILFFVVPSTVLLLTLRAQIIRVILGTGQFDWDDTIMTIDTLGFFALSLFAQATIPLLVRVFYARQNSRTPFVIGFVSAGINILLSFYLSRKMGGPGLALAFSLANLLNFILLWLSLRSEIGHLDEARILASATKFSAAALAAGVAVQGAKLLVWPYIDMTRLWGVMAQGVAAGLAGALVYIAFCSLLKSEELSDFWEAIKRRMPGKKPVTGDHGEARGI